MIDLGQLAPTSRPAKQVRNKLYGWQREALVAWQNAGRRGVVQATTGAGKTMVAMAAIEELRAADPRTCVAIVVPTVVLAQQWRKALGDHLGIYGTMIGECHSRAGDDLWCGQNIALFVINSARDKLALVRGRWALRSPGAPVLLIVDECHRSGSDQNSRILDISASFTLGISATPERLDLGHETRIYPGLGDVVFTYNLATAIGDAVVADTRAVNLYVRFNTSEQARWDELEDWVVRHSNVVLAQHGAVSRSELVSIARTNPTAHQLLRKLEAQEQIIERCANRETCARELLDWIERSREKVIVFNESIDTAEAVYNQLRNRTVRAALEHSERTADEREEALSDFRRGFARVLVAVRSLDEGVDIPDAEVAVVLRGGTTLRQRLQRVGRVARRAKGKDRATVITILALSSPEAALVGLRDEQLFGTDHVTHHLWPATRVVDAVNATNSSMNTTQIPLPAVPLLGAFLGLDEQDTEPLPPGRAGLLADLASVRQALRDERWSLYAASMRSATDRLVDLGADEEIRWEITDTMPYGELPSLHRYQSHRRRALRSLMSASDLARSTNERHLTSALLKLAKANCALREAAATEQQLHRDLAEHKTRVLLNDIVNEAERVASANEPDAAARMKGLRKMWRTRGDTEWLSDDHEYRGLVTRLNSAQVMLLDRIVAQAEDVCGRTDAPSCDLMGKTRRDWLTARSGVWKRDLIPIEARLRLAARATLLALIEEAEAGEATTDDRAASVQRRWRRSGAPFDDAMSESLGPRLERALADRVADPPACVSEKSFPPSNVVNRDSLGSA